VPSIHESLKLWDLEGLWFVDVTHL
jgi:hypothetical protein